MHVADGPSNIDVPVGRQRVVSACIFSTQRVPMRQYNLDNARFSQWGRHLSPTSPRSFHHHCMIEKYAPRPADVASHGHAKMPRRLWQ